MRDLRVSCMKRDMTKMGAAMNMMTQIEKRQLWLYSAMIYAPVRGPKDGPRNGAKIKKMEARPLWWCNQRSAIVPMAC